MGLIKGAKAGGALQEAERARQDGMPVFVYRFEMPHWGSSHSGSVSGAAEVIEAIEAAGWALTQIAGTAGEGNRGAFVMIFRPTGQPVR
jgi:hypothetical protein